ncbi:hypothetical protein SAMN02910456_01213 [Ruminococcaceae bacterium YRB3002]|nr:hypothetical protein SAMN02910456_01213 [Ruminococcaceae bacterium YRB3002]
MMRRRLKEWFSIRLAKNPGQIVLLTILVFNVVFLLLSAFIISRMSLSGTEHLSFIEAAYYTVTMILDAGCVSFVIEDIGQTNAVVAIVCLLIIIVGMVSFTGAVIGYLSNYISSFIENAGSGKRRLHLYNHFIILNWNNRASEIINDLLYMPGRQKVVVFVEEGKERIEKEIYERLADTINTENRRLKKSLASKNFISRRFEYRARKMTNNILSIVREGDIYSSKQLYDISMPRARSVIILGSDNTRSAEENKGNVQTLKTLMQVAEITSAANSNDNQKIIVEISDDWTEELVEKIISYKQVDSKCNIVPIKVHKVLGQLLSQFSITPELNNVYNELLSNKGTTFFEHAVETENDNDYITEYLKTHRHAIPLASLETGGRQHFFYTCGEEQDIFRTCDASSGNYSVSLNPSYRIEKKNVIILGHNSKCHEIMEGFAAFAAEWEEDRDAGRILSIIVIDDAESLERMNNYDEYDFVIETVPTSIYDKETIYGAIEKIVADNDEDISILILSDDYADSENVDATALTNLVYVQDIINNMKAEDPDFDEESIDVVVEIIDPKHYDVVNSYSVKNVVISNRYISKMITQIGEKDAIFDFYQDILTFDTEEGEFDSKEIYAKKVSSYFNEIPGECTVEEFIRAVWEASLNTNYTADGESHTFPAMAIGYVRKGGDVCLFSGDQSASRVCLGECDKVVLYTVH